MKAASLHILEVALLAASIEERLCLSIDLHRWSDCAGRPKG